jgi:hypothetical protein
LRFEAGRSLGEGGKKFGRELEGRIFPLGLRKFVGKLDMVFEVTGGWEWMI